jgi:hypothetical protein
MDIMLIKVMGIAVAIVLPITFFIISKIDQKDKIRNNIGSGLAIKKSKNSNTIYRIYLLFNHLPITKQYIENIRRRYEILYPGNRKDIAKRTMKTVILSWTLCALAVVLIVRSNLNIINSTVAMLLIYVIHTEFTGFMLQYTEIKLLEEIAVFISNVRHNYHINRMVDDAILLSMESLGYEMKVHANKLYEIVLSNNIKEEVANYNAAISNKYLRMFLSLCVSVLEKNSDKKVNGQLLFTVNLENLRKEIDIEILKQKKIRFLFSGVSLVTISVIIPIDAIKNYGISMLSELDNFYNGRLGIIYVAVTQILTMIIYLLNNRLKGANRIKIGNYSYLKWFEKKRLVKVALDNYIEKNYGKIMALNHELKRIGETISVRQFILQRLLFAAGAFLITIGFLYYIHENNKDHITDKIQNAASFTTAVSSSQIETVEKIILEYVKIYKNDPISEKEILSILSGEGIFYNTKVKEAVAGEIYFRIQAYQNEFFKWYELLICLCIAILTYYIPYFLLWYKKKVFQMSMEDEVNQFNSIIYMLMYNDNLTVKDLLIELELFAVVFKRTLQECLNEFNSGEIEALQKMKAKEAFIPFKRLVDNLIRCDAISIDKAFDEISCDRENYHDRRKQENEISIQKRADIAKPLSFIPTVLVMVYLTLPLLLASLEEIAGFKDMMNNL